MIEIYAKNEKYEESGNSNSNRVMRNKSSNSYLIHGRKEKIHVEIELSNY